jgi:hypothetical protein
MNCLAFRHGTTGDAAPPWQNRMALQKLIEAGRIAVARESIENCTDQSRHRCHIRFAKLRRRFDERLPNFDQNAAQQIAPMRSLRQHDRENQIIRGRDYFSGAKSPQISRLGKQDIGRHVDSQHTTRRLQSRLANARDALLLCHGRSPVGPEMIIDTKHDRLDALIDKLMRRCDERICSSCQEIEVAAAKVVVIVFQFCRPVVS